MTRSVLYMELFGVLLATLLTSCSGAGPAPTGPSPTPPKGATTWP